MRIDGNRSRTVATRRVVPLIVVASLALAACGSRNESRGATSEPSAELAARVSAAAAAVTPSTVDEVAFAIVANRRAHEALARCMQAKGETYPEYVAPTIDTARLSQQRPQPGWYRRPSREVAAVDVPSIVTFADYGDFTATLTAAAKKRHDTASAECFIDNPPADPVDWAAVWEIENKMDFIASSTFDMAAFASIRDPYVTCMKEGGASVTDPSELTSEMVQDASVDERCRGTMYDAFVGLRAADWEAFLQAESINVQAVAAMFAALRKEAGI